MALISCSTFEWRSSRAVREAIPPSLLSCYPARMPSLSPPIIPPSSLGLWQSSRPPKTPCNASLVSSALFISSGQSLFPRRRSSCNPESSQYQRASVFSNFNIDIQRALQTANELSNSKEARRCFSRAAASLFSDSPEENSASGSSEGAKIDLNLPRRRLQLAFTCDACGARSRRLINPDAYARGTVFVQCAGCEVYHKLVDNLGLIEEYDFRQETSSKADGADLNGLE